MLSGVSRAAGGAQASAPDKKALEAKRQEILKNAQAQGGGQAKAVQSGKRQAAAQTGGEAGQAAGKAGDTAPKTQTAAAQGQPKRAGWEVSQDTKPYSGNVKRRDAKPDEGKGAKVDVTG